MKLNVVLPINNLKVKPNKAWITFLDDDFECKWHRIDLPNGEQMDFDCHKTMDYCRIVYSDRKFGIACTEQMLINNASRDNF